jgi:ABC-type microcin C transport system permease subunit YejE
MVQSNEVYPPPMVSGLYNLGKGERQTLFVGFHMKEIMMTFSALIGGLFSGALAGLFAFFVWGLVKEGLEEPKKMAIPAMFLLGILGSALAYVVGVVFQSWSLFIGAAISFTYVVRPLFKAEK